MARARWGTIRWGIARWWGRVTGASPGCLHVEASLHNTLTPAATLANTLTATEAAPLNSLTTSSAFANRLEPTVVQLATLTVTLEVC